MNAIFAKGLNVPEDISVIGFDDIGISQYMTPRLSTVKRPVENISILGAEDFGANRRPGYGGGKNIRKHRGDDKRFH